MAKKLGLGLGLGLGLHYKTPTLGPRLGPAFDVGPSLGGALRTSALVQGATKPWWRLGGEKLA